MRRLAKALLRRNALAVAGQAGVLCAVGAIALIFAWMSPSLRESELAVWDSLPQGVHVSTRADPGDPSCLALYSVVTVMSPSGQVIGHPDVAVVGAGAANALTLPQLGAGDAAVDAVAGAQLGVGLGDRVTVHVGVGAPTELRLVVLSSPIRLHAASQGTLFVATLPSEVTQLYGPPDQGMCFGPDGRSGSEVAQQLREQHASEGLASATEVFGGVAGLAWSGTVLTASTATALRRRQMVSLLRAMGVRDSGVGALIVCEVAVAGLVALAGSTLLAQAVRAHTLRMWTSPTAQVLTTIIGATLTVLCVSLVASITVRLVRR